MAPRPSCEKTEAARSHVQGIRGPAAKRPKRHKMLYITYDIIIIVSIL